MAKFKSSTFGKISGKHGDVVAVTMKDGTCYFRAYIIPPNPNTAKQQSQRAVFGFVVKELNCMRKLFAITFNGQYGINKAVSLAMKTCVTGEFPDFRLDYSKLQIAVGNLPVSSFQNIGKITSALFRLNWNYDESTVVNFNDEISIVLLDNYRKQVIHFQNIAKRSSGMVDFSIPDFWLGSEIHTWMYFSSPNNSRFSESKYLGLLSV